MENLLIYLEKSLQEHTFIQGTMSLVRRGVDKTFSKVNVKPFQGKEDIMYQITYTYDKKVTHENLSGEETGKRIKVLMTDYFRNANFYTVSKDYQVMTSKKGSVKIIEKNGTKTLNLGTHNRKKQYIIEEGENCDFLKYLGVMSSNGLVHAKKYDKFKQINKFLEIVENSLSHFDKGRPIKIIDFGCGKAYLTFALYYYLVKRQGYEVDIIGLDLKEDVIDYCNKVAGELEYKGLTFLKGDIKNYDYGNEVDMVITLHACDTATDAALSKAIGWNAKVILSVPCCQHELFKQIDNDILNPMLKHGLIKERLSALVTDAMRTQLLEVRGYGVTVIEFVDMEHTPKNLMIKAVKGSEERGSKEAMKQYEAFRDFFHIKPYLEDELL